MTRRSNPWIGKDPNYRIPGKEENEYHTGFLMAVRCCSPHSMILDFLPLIVQVLEKRNATSRVKPL
jgi:hypothetical protein